jgi:hypothetical protein
VIIDLTSQSPSTAPRDQFRNFHHAAERVVPHHEQTISSLPINRLQRGQRIARCVIKIPRKLKWYASEVSHAALPHAFSDHLTLPLPHFTSKIKAGYVPRPH